MRHLKLTIAYDGGAYCGWQVQPNGVSVQALLESAWTKITGETIRITASGRTDAGVHALRQVCSLATNNQIPLDKLTLALNASTPFDICVRSIEPAPEGFHAIRDAVGKTYQYQLQFGRIQDPLRLSRCWFTPIPFDVERMIQGAEHLVGEYDFASFQGANSDRKTTVRRVTKLNIVPNQINGFPGASVEISANGFLYNMVRNIVGTLVRVGQQRENPDWVVWVRDQLDRTCAGQTAPAQGLYLVEVDYGDLFESCFIGGNECPTSPTSQTQESLRGR